MTSVLMIFDGDPRNISKPDEPAWNSAMEETQNDAPTLFERHANL